MASSLHQQPIRKVFILAGEASGDAYGGALVKELKAISPDVEIRGWGGESMDAAGAKVMRHYSSLAFMGLWEVLVHIRQIRRLWKECVAEMEAFQPDAFVGIDYPGFNLRMARFAHKKGIRTHHYISPSVWAWKKRRIKSIARDVDVLHVILPFEQPWYAEHGMDVHWVGHPLLELMERAEHKPGQTEVSAGSDLPMLLLVPGSRKQELERMLPAMLGAAQKLTSFKAVIAGAPGRSEKDYPPTSQTGIPVVFGQTRELMAKAAIGLVTSGTATLEAALIGMPQVIGYRTSALTFGLAKRLVKTDWIGLPNLLLGRASVPELIQSKCTAESLAEAVRTLHDGTALTAAGENQRADQTALKAALTGPGKPSALVAQSILHP